MTEIQNGSGEQESSASEDSPRFSAVGEGVARTRRHVNSVIGSRKDDPTMDMLMENIAEARRERREYPVAGSTDTRINWERRALMLAEELEEVKAERETAGWAWDVLTTGQTEIICLLTKERDALKAQLEARERELETYRVYCDRVVRERDKARQMAEEAGNPVPLLYPVQSIEQQEQADRERTNAVSDISPRKSADAAIERLEEATGRLEKCVRGKEDAD